MLVLVLGELLLKLDINLVMQLLEQELLLVVHHVLVQDFVTLDCITTTARGEYITAGVGKW